MLGPTRFELYEEVDKTGFSDVIELGKGVEYEGNADIVFVVSNMISVLSADRVRGEKYSGVDNVDVIVTGYVDGVRKELESRGIVVV